MADAAMPPAVTQDPMRSPREAAVDGPPLLLDPLTEREVDVLRLLGAWRHWPNVVRERGRPRHALHLPYTCPIPARGVGYRIQSPLRMPIAVGRYPNPS